MTYALLIYRTTPPGQPIPELEDRAVLAGHRAVQAEAEARGALHAVAQLAQTGQARVVSAHEVTDGPYIEAKEWLVGFYLLDCASEAEAIAQARRLCPDGAHVVEVRPVVWRWEPRA